ncbi:hypothetical protein D3C85_1163280 [compost metagenome]
MQVTEPTGPDLLVFVTLNQTKVCCRLAPDVACRVGDSLNLQFDPARVLLFDAASGEPQVKVVRKLFGKTLKNESQEITAEDFKSAIGLMMSDMRALMR